MIEVVKTRDETTKLTTELGRGDILVACHGDLTRILIRQDNSQIEWRWARILEGGFSFRVSSICTEHTTQQEAAEDKMTYNFKVYAFESVSKACKWIAERTAK